MPLKHGQKGGNTAGVYHYAFKTRAKKEETMLKIGEKVLYGAAGACTVTEICTRKFGEAGEREYYVLMPVHDARTTLYVPVDSEALRAKMKRLLSVEEIEKLIASMPQEEALWIADEKARQETYKGMLRRGDRRELIGMAKALYSHRQKLTAAGRRLHVADERLFKEAEKLLCDEFAVVLNLKPSEVMGFIAGKLKE